MENPYIGPSRRALRTRERCLGAAIFILVSCAVLATYVCIFYSFRAWQAGHDDSSENSTATAAVSHIYRDGLDSEATPSDMPSPGDVSSITLRRGPGGPWQFGVYTYYCGIFHTADPSTARVASVSLQADNDSFAVPPQTCLRTYCKDTTAVYACNDNDTTTLAVSGNDVGWMASQLSMLCCDTHHGLSAQLFHPTAGWNTVVGYGNCRHGATDAPSSYGESNGGVNGECVADPSGDNGSQLGSATAGGNGTSTGNVTDTGEQ